jgi:hypothetical protein
MRQLIWPGFAAVEGRQAPQHVPMPSGQCVHSALLAHSATHSPVCATATPAQAAAQLFE